MEKIKQQKYVILISLIILGFVFYWFELRPNNIRKECIKTYPDAFRIPTDDNGIGRLISVGNYKGSIDKAGYEKCLRENGLDR
ncbi:MAG TPA: hypothetical protein VJC13_03195 [Candidatus Paceibacterota bacterium]